MRRLFGKTSPRLFTAPLRPLTPETSAGYQVLQWWREKLSWKPMPWQRWVVLHALELNEDGSLRFKQILLLCSRQNGKSSLITYLILYWLMHDSSPILSSSSSLDVSKETWENVVEIIEEMPEVFGDVKVIRINGNWEIKLKGRNGRYKIISSSRRAGRGLTAKRLVLDELREHLDWDSYAAASSTTVAQPDSQTWMLSNAGDARSVVLDHFRARALSGEDISMGIFEYSAPDNAEITDIEALRQANPALGFTITLGALESKMSQPVSVFKTENMCMSVPALDEVIKPEAWAMCLDSGDLREFKSRLSLCLDVSEDMMHATLCVAATLPDGRTRVGVVQAWTSLTAMRTDLPELLKSLKAKQFGWFPAGPAAAVALTIKDLKGAKPIQTKDVPAVCMGMAEQVKAGLIAQNGDELIASHLLSAKKRSIGDGWVFSRRDSGHLDAAYAAAGAVHLARQLPKPGKLRVLGPKAASNA